jgi:hypothetical protein
VWGSILIESISAAWAFLFGTFLFGVEVRKMVLKGLFWISHFIQSKEMTNEKKLLSVKSKNNFQKYI